MYATAVAFIKNDIVPPHPHHSIIAYECFEQHFSKTELHMCHPIC